MHFVKYDPLGSFQDSWVSMKAVWCLSESGDVFDHFDGEDSASVSADRDPLPRLCSPYSFYPVPKTKLRNVAPR